MLPDRVLVRVISASLEYYLTDLVHLRHRQSLGVLERVIAAGLLLEQHHGLVGLRECDAATERALGIQPSSPCLVPLPDPERGCANEPGALGGRALS